ncbi:MAG TPA: alkaline phosphatase family protein [Candidatus Binatia bacterium]|nr:alkaline phosphatase family protein [Candidatus Binatia bacterium]
MVNLDLVKTIVVVMMENRSFDHMLGYLSLEGYPVNGLQPDPWLSQVANPYEGFHYRPFEYTNTRVPADPPHERGNIGLQLDSGSTGTLDLRGFVQSYADVCPVNPDSPPAVMGYYTKSTVPLFDTLARAYAVCDRWFAPLPAGTQPNRLMAMSGTSLIDTNTFPLPRQPLVYDWLSGHGVRWRVYHEAMPFFALMLHWIPAIVRGDNFRSLEHLQHDLHHEDDGQWPQVIFIEPKYGDDPTHIGEPTDHHPPASIIRGQEFIAKIYATLTSHPDRWRQTVLILTYDEHGGFFDHVPPISQATSGQGNYDDFRTTGVRVPALVVSPLVNPGTVYSGDLDHTSILKFLGEKFDANKVYSTEVEHRRLVGSVSSVLNAPAARTDIPRIQSLPPDSEPVPTNVSAFTAAANAMRTGYPDDVRQRFPEIWHVEAP